MLRILLAALHLVALGLGLGAVIWRGSSLRAAAADGESARGTLAGALRADALWGVAALLWLATGLWRLLAGTEKPTNYYLGNHAFWGKMALFVVIVLLEIGPAMTLGRWRKALARGTPPSEAMSAPAARRIAITSHVQALLVVLMVFAATAMARGLGAGR